MQERTPRFAAIVRRATERARELTVELIRFARSELVQQCPQLSLTLDGLLQQVFNGRLLLRDVTPLE